MMKRDKLRDANMKIAAWYMRTTYYFDTAVCIKIKVQLQSRPVEFQFKSRTVEFQQASNPA
jgi:hypothetical protein